MGHSDNIAAAKKAVDAKKVTDPKKATAAKSPRPGPPPVGISQSLPVRNVPVASGSRTMPGVDAGSERPPSRPGSQRESSRPSSSQSNISTATSTSRVSQRSYESTISATSGNSDSSKKSGNSHNSNNSKRSDNSNYSSGTYQRRAVLPGALEVFRDLSCGRGEKRVWEEVDKKSIEHTEMRECVNVAMCILSRARNRRALSTYSTELVDAVESTHRSTAGHMDIYGPEMPATIDAWLWRMSEGFPRVNISHSIPDRYAETGRWTWGDHVSQYVPQEAAYINVHYGVSYGFSVILNGLIILS